MQQLFTDSLCQFQDLAAHGIPAKALLLGFYIFLEFHCPALAEEIKDGIGDGLLIHRCYIPDLLVGNDLCQSPNIRNKHRYTEMVSNLADPAVL